MFTPFGKKLREIRMEHNEILKDMADRLGVSSSFLSAVEVGKKNVPEGWCSLIGEMYQLDKIETQNLLNLAEESAKNIKIDLRNSSENKRRAATVFARTFEDMSETQAKQIIDLMKNNCGQ